MHAAVRPLNNDAGEARHPELPPLPNPVVIVANGGSSNIALIDPADLTVLTTLSVRAGMHPHHIGVAPDHSHVLITATSADMSHGHGGNADNTGHAGHAEAGASTLVYRLDLKSQDFQEVLMVAATAHNATFTPDGTLVVLGMMEHGMIAGYNSVTYAEEFSALGFEGPLEVTPTGVNSLLVAESSASRVATFDLLTHTISGYFQTGAIPVAAWASGTANYFVAAEAGKRLTHLVERDGAVVSDQHAIELGGAPGQAAISPNGSELWVALEDTGVVAILDATTHQPLAEVPAGLRPHGITFDASSTRAFVTDEQGGKVSVIDASSRAVVAEVPLGGNPNGIVWLSR